MKKRALITGITGQDGSYLAELLLEKDYEVQQPILGHINAGSSCDISIIELARMVAKVTRYIATDPTKPDSTPRKLMDINRLTQMGWRTQIGLKEEISQIYRWFLANSKTWRAL